MIIIKSNSRFIQRTRRKKSCATKKQSLLKRIAKFIGDYKFYRALGATRKEAFNYAKNSF